MDGSLFCYSIILCYFAWMTTIEKRLIEEKPRGMFYRSSSVDRGDKAMTLSLFRNRTNALTYSNLSVSEEYLSVACL